MSTLPSNSPLRQTCALKPISAILVISVAASGCGPATASRQPVIKSLSSAAVRSICLRLSAPGPGHYITERQAVRTIDMSPSNARYGTRISVAEAVPAVVHDREPILAAVHHAMWVIVTAHVTARQAVVYFVDAVTGSYVMYLRPYSGCI